jgi:hypothetical protein
VRAEFCNEPDPNQYTKPVVFPTLYVSCYSKLEGPFRNKIAFDLNYLEEYPIASEYSKDLFEQTNCKSVHAYAIILRKAQLFQLADGLRHFTFWCIKTSIFLHYTVQLLHHLDSMPYL